MFSNSPTVSIGRLRAARNPIPRRQSPYLSLILWASFTATLVYLIVHGGLYGQGSEPEIKRSFGLLAGGVGAGLISQLPRIGQVVGRLIGRGGASRFVSGGTSRALVPVSQGSRIGSLARRTALVGGAGAAFEAGTRAFPGGRGLDLGPITIGGSSGGFGGGGGGGGMEGLNRGARFGDTFIVRVWSTGATSEGVPIIHGILANGKHFVTNRFGSIKVFRPRKNIVIGADPKLSDARKVARAASRMEKAATDILKVTGKKAVKR